MATVESEIIPSPCRPPATEFSMPLLLPWRQRTVEQWMTQVSKEETSRLFYLAYQNRPLSLENDWISYWSLDMAYQAYWQEDRDGLMARIAEEDQHNTQDIPIKDIELGEQIKEVFLDYDIFPFLLTARRLDRERVIERKYSSKFFTQVGLYAQTAQSLGWEAVKVNTLQSQYQRLVEAFLPRAKDFGSQMVKHNYMDYEEALAFSAVNLSATTLRFYWETAVLDPQWTIQRFLKTLAVSIQDTRSQVYDTRTLEVSFEKGTDIYESWNNTEEQVFRNISEEKVNSAIADFSNMYANQFKLTKETMEEILTLTINNRESKLVIASKLGISVHKAGEVIKTFREDLYQKSADGLTDLPVMPPRKGGKSPFWDNLFGDIEKYQAKYLQYRMRLTPFHRRLLDKFFEMQTGQRSSTIDVLIDCFPTIKRDTIRRQLTGAFNRLDYKEPSDRLNPDKTWERDQMRLVVLKIKDNPNIWSTFNDRRQYILNRFYVDSPEQEITRFQIAKELGVNEGTVSRELDRVRMLLCRDYYGSIYKSRHLLPK